jgi:hypothetical protein
MRQSFILVTLLSLALGESAIAQYPFERLPVLQRQVTVPWVVHDPDLTGEGELTASVAIPNVFPTNDSCIIVIRPAGDTASWGVDMYIFRNERLLQVFKSDTLCIYYFNISSTSTADFNGDSLTDIKFVYDYHSNGLGLSHRVFFLIQRKDGLFTRVSFYDQSTQDFGERSFDKGKSFAIIGTTLERFRNHSYWAFNLYRFSGDSLEGISTQYDYPLMVQFLYRSNYLPTSSIPKRARWGYSKILPPEFTRSE